MPTRTNVPAREPLPTRAEVELNVLALPIRERHRYALQLLEDGELEPYEALALVIFGRGDVVLE